jgi:hypothetical protein
MDYGCDGWSLDYHQGMRKESNTATRTKQSEASSHSQLHPDRRKTVAPRPDLLTGMSRAFAIGSSGFAEVFEQQVMAQG